MKKFRTRLWLYTLCMGIVMTVGVAWFLGDQRAGSSKILESSGHQSVAQKKVVESAASAPKRKAISVAPSVRTEPFHAVALNRFQERLLKNAVMLDRRRIEPRGNEPAKEVRLWRTDFKYSLVREETLLGRDPQGQLQPVRRDFSVADHVMVKFPSGVTQQRMNDWARKHHFSLRQTLKTTDVQLISASEESMDTADRIMTAFRQAFPHSPEQAAVAERDYLVFPSLLPDDTSFSQLWGMHNTGQTGGTADADIDAVEAWDLTTGSREVLVGVIDTGVDRTHPDLVANMWRNPNEIAGNGVDDDRNGFVDDVNGWDFFADDNDPMDENNHGTHCSGTIGGVGNNVTGVTGVCWQVSIVGIRFLGPSGGTTSDAIDSINYSRTLGVDLTSNSWGGGGFSALLQTAIVNAGQADQLFVVAAGNDGANMDLSLQYPAGYSAENIVSVASSTDRDARSSFSNYGRTSVDIAAPGSSILSTVRGGGYLTYSGTSMATPHVAGAAALLKSLAPTISATQIKAELLTTVDPLPAFATTTVSGGRLNVERLVTGAAGPRPIISVTTIEEQAGGNGDGISNPGEALALRFTVHNRGTEPAQNVQATLTTIAKDSRYTITRGVVNLGNLTRGQTLASATTFLVQSKPATPTPYAEEFLITLTYGTPQEKTEHRVTLYLHTSSQIAGTVNRVSEGTPISGATVFINGPVNRTIDTGTDGRYSATVTDGVYQIHASALGFVPSLAVTKNVPPSARDVDFSLGIPQLQLTPNAMVANTYVNRDSSQTLEMRNDGTAALAWSLKLNERQVNVVPAQRIFTLPEAPINKRLETADGGSRASFKTMESSVAPALELPLDSLIGKSIGAVSTDWDRSLLISDLQARGATVVTLNLPLTTADLETVDAVIVDDSIASFKVTDMELLRARVAAGAGVLCEADNSSSIQRVNELFNSTGIQAVSDTFRDLSFTDIRAHSMTVGVTVLQEFAVGASATITGSAQVLVQDPNGRAHAAMTRLGAGVLVFVGNEISDSSSFEFGDARRFVNQIMDGLVGQVTWLSAGAHSGYIQAGGSYMLPLNFSAKGQEAGIYEAEAIFDTNIPDQADQRLPITMTVKDAPQISGNVDRLDFGSVVEGVIANQTLTLSNTGTLPLNVRSIRIAGPDARYFSLQTAAPFQISPKAYHSLGVIFDPAAPIRAHAAQLVIDSDDPTLSSMTVPLMAERQLPPGLLIKAKEVKLQLREGQSGFVEVTLENRGKGTLSWQMSLPNAPPWAKIAGARGRIFPRASGKNRLDFDTGSLRAGDYETTLEIITNDLVSPVTVLPVRLRVIATPRPIFAQSVSFSNVVIGEQSDKTVEIINAGSADLVISSITSYAPSFACLSALPFSVPAGQRNSLIIRFKPTKAGGAAGSLILGTNSPERFTFLTVSGVGIRGPTLRVNPASLSLSSAPGVTLQRSILLTNSGDLSLSWSLTLDVAGNCLTTSSTAGFLQRGSSEEIRLEMITNQMPAGSYSAKLTIASNDKVRPSVVIPIRMQVTRTGTLALSKPNIQFAEIWTDAVQQESVMISNSGNAPFDILSAVPSSHRMTVGINLPVRLEPGDQVPIIFQYSSPLTGVFKDECKITTSIRSNRVVTLPVNAKVVSPPTIAITPSRVDEALDPGDLIERDITLKNEGGAALTWTSSVIEGVGPELPLADVLSQFNSNAVLLQTKIPFAYAFPQGTTGDRILETATTGIFNGGNIHATNLASSAAIPYSDNVLATHPGVGASGTYFTRKANSLFIFAADLDQVSAFNIQGQLSTGGAGVVEVSNVTRIVAGTTYRGFFKQVYGLSRPAVNHLFIVADKLGIHQRFSADSTLDDHEVNGLSGKTRLYHLLFCTIQGRKVTEAEVTRLMDSFLINVVHPMQPEWLKLTPASGTVAAEGEKVQVLQIDTRTLPGGSYGATLRFNSNAIGRSQIDVPVTVQLPSRFLLRAQPQPFVFPDTYAFAQTYQACEITNVGNLAVTLSAINSSDSAITSSGIILPKILQPRESTTMNLRFDPKEVRDYSATVTLSSAGVSEPALVIPISGRGTSGPLIEATPKAISLTVDPGSTVTETINIANEGGAALKWSASTSSNLTSLTTLSRITGTTLPKTISPIVLSVRTTASSSAGTTTGSVILISDDPRKPNVTIPVSIAVRPVPKLTLSLPVVSFADTYVQSTSIQTLTLRNTGNANLTISSITSADPQFGWLPINTPLQLGVGQSRTMTLKFTPVALGSYNGEIRFTTNSPSEPEVILSAFGRCVNPPVIRVQPEEVVLTLPKGASETKILTINNDGGAVLSWQHMLICPSLLTGNLQDILQRVNDHHSAISALIPDLYSFLEGESGASISDGGNDMYDTGNILGTSIGSSIAYSNNQVIAGAALGAGGRYFTSKRDGLFIFAADLDGATSFSIRGDLGADGYGNTNAAVLTRTVNGITYKGFFKSVSGANDPSVNHLIMVEDKPTITHSYSSNTNLDDHSVMGLSGSTRLYYLLFARANGAAVSSSLAASIMDLFLSDIALPNGLPWVTTTPISGNTASGASSPVSLKFNTSQVEVGTHTAVLRLMTNASNASSLDVPVSLRVTPRLLEVSPSSMETIRLQNQSAPLQSIQLTALAGTQPAWTAKSDAAWMTLSKTSGTGTDSFQLIYDPSLSAGDYSTTISVHCSGAITIVPVTLSVRAAEYTKLLTDYHRPRMLGLIRGLSSAPSLLVALDHQTLTTQNILPLPTDITDADITTDGKLLYGISFAGRTISEVDLETFTLSSTRSIPAPVDVGVTAPYHYHVEAGRPGIVYYTDAANNPRLHVFDFNAGVDLSTFLPSSGAGIGDFVVTPDGNSIYAWSQNGWGTAGSSTLMRISCGADTLTMVGQSSAVLSQAPLEAPIFYSAGAAAVITKNYQFSSDLNISRGYVPAAFYGASAYGNALASANEIISSETGATLQTYTAKNGVLAFTGDQKALIYLHGTLNQLVRLTVPNLSSTDLSPRFADGGLLPAAPSSLLWNSSPTAASYDVYLGTDSAAVAAANNQASGTAYLGNTPATSFSINPSTLQLGVTYYWRIDIRNLDNSTVKGSIWSFRLPAVTSTSQTLSVAALSGSTNRVQTSLFIITAQSNTPWTLSENTPWLSLDATSGTGSATVSLSLDPTGLAAASHVAQISLSSGTDSVIIAVTFRLLGALNIIKMEADANLQRVYALHIDSSSPFDAWLLWIDPRTARIDQLLRLGTDASDFAVHTTDDRIYVLTQNGTRIMTVQRQQPQIVRTLILPSPVVALHNGPVGRVIVRSSGNVLQMLNSTSGALVGSSISLPECITRTSGNGTQLYAAVQQSATLTGIQRYTLSNTGISIKTGTYWNGSLGARFVVSGNGERAFYNQAAYSVSDSVTQTSTLPATIVASSWNGQMAFSAAQSHSTTAQSEVLAAFPFTTAVMASTFDHSRLVLFSPTSRTLLSIDPGALALAPSSLDFGMVPLGSTQSMNITVNNLTNQDLTLNVNSTKALFKVPSTPVTINAGQFAQIAISSTFISVGSFTGILNFSVVGQTQFNRSATVTAQVMTTNPVTVDFSTGAPADNSQISSATYTEDGLIFTSPNQILRVGGNHINRPNNGTPHIAPLSNQRPLSIKRSNNGVFHLYSVDMAEHSYLYAAQKTIIFNGVKSTGANVTTSFTLDGITDSTGPLADFQTFTFPSSFRDLVSAEVTVDLYALDNLVFETAAGTSVAAESKISSPEAPFDLDSDGLPDLWVIGSDSRFKDNTVTKHRFTYTRRSGIKDSTVTIQASRDGQAWSSLTLGIDYTIEDIKLDQDGARETLQLLIPTASDIPWQFRLISTP